MSLLPVTIVSGFTGAGKTAVLQHLQANLPEMKFAVIADAGDRTALLKEVARQSASGRFNYLLIEATGISEPLKLAEIFSCSDCSGNDLCDIAKIDTMVTVVDAERFFDDFQSVDEVRDRGIGRDDCDDRDIARVLIDQIEFANVILLNRTDLISAEESGQLLAVLSKLNPDARVLSIKHGKVPVEDIVNTGRYQLEWSEGSDAWQTRLAGDENSESDAYGICSFVYRARRPFHPQRFWDFWMDGEHAPNILRSKGYFWLATKNAMSGFWSHAGQVLAAEPGGIWWAETPREEWPDDDPELIAELKSVWDDVWGDRRQELMIIGQDLDIAAAKNALDACLLTDSEMQSGPPSWTKLSDPFGAWEEVHDCDGSRGHG